MYINELILMEKNMVFELLIDHNVKNLGCVFFIILNKF